MHPDCSLVSYIHAIKKETASDNPYRDVQMLRHYLEAEGLQRVPEMPAAGDASDYPELQHSNQRGGVMTIRKIKVAFFRTKKWLEDPVCRLMAALTMMGLALALILAFDIQDPSMTFAIVLLCWGCFSVPISIVAGRIASGMAVADRDHLDH